MLFRSRGSSAVAKHVYVASIEQDVPDEGGAVVIPKGSAAGLTVNKLSKSDLSLVLASVTIDGIKYAVDSADVNQSSRRNGIGKNRRTGEMVGGGAATGALIGGIAGGGVGALLGAAAGAGAGGAAQTLTRGKEVVLPTESVLRFHLSQPLALAEKK